MLRKAENWRPEVPDLDLRPGAYEPPSELPMVRKDE
jgi:hypothetical protein